MWHLVIILLVCQKIDALIYFLPSIFEDFLFMVFSIIWNRNAYLYVNFLLQPLENV